MMKQVGAFLLRWAASAAVLWMAVGWVTPGNDRNTLLRAALLSLFLAFAWFITLARFLWFMLLPWLLYATIWIATVMLGYGLGFLQALLLAVALTVLNLLVGLVVGLRTL